MIQGRVGMIQGALILLLFHPHAFPDFLLPINFSKPQFYNVIHSPLQQRALTSLPIFNFCHFHEVPMLKHHQNTHLPEHKWALQLHDTLCSICLLCYVLPCLTFLLTLQNPDHLFSEVLLMLTGWVCYPSLHPQENAHIAITALTTLYRIIIIHLSHPLDSEVPERRNGTLLPGKPGAYSLICVHCDEGYT